MVENEKTVSRLWYTSVSKIDLGDAAAALAAILTTSRKANQAKGITGALLLDGDKFAQILEGAPGDLAALYEQICADLRHTDVSLIGNVDGVKRVFPTWAMALVSPDEDRDIPLFASGDTLAEGADRKFDDVQNRLLSILRLAARS